MPNEAIAPSKPTRIRKTRPVLAPAPPPALQSQVTRAAKVLTRHTRVLGELGMEALRVATLQVVAQKLAELQALLASQGMSGPVAAARPQSQNVQHPCAICGRPGTYQSRTAKVERGQQRPWYCRGEHEQWARKEDGEAATAAGMLPTMQPAAGAPNLRAALDLLSGEGE